MAESFFRLLNLEHLNPAQQVLESLTYTYDANGNRISMGRPSVPLPLPQSASNTSYNDANHMLSFTDKNITYDENGNMASVTNGCGTTNYTWDARNRLVAISGYKPDCPALTASFSYCARHQFLIPESEKTG
jgi:YD repeat-containing protein